MSGKMTGSLYKVFISPSGVKYYSLKKAAEQGMKDDERDGAEPKKPKRVRKGNKLKKLKSKLPNESKKSKKG